jgi:branched-chain amino acid transport system permease protein
VRQRTLIEGSPQLRALRLGALLAGLALMIVLPRIVAGTQINVLSQMIAYAVAILGLVLLTGYTGQISIGHSAFVGVGAYTTLILVANHGWSWLVTLPASFLLCVLAGAIVGIPALRISGLYLATVTLALAVMFPSLVDRLGSLTGGTAGLFAPSGMAVPSWFPVSSTSLDGQAEFHYYVILAVALLVFVLVRNLVRSRVGRALIAIRDTPYAATASGIKLSRYKVAAFALSAGIAGIAGSLLAIQIPDVFDTQFDLLFAVYLLIGLVAGGRTSIYGAIPGALVFVALRNWIPNGVDSLNLLSGNANGGQTVGIISGLLLIAFAFLLPGGAIEGLTRIGNRLVRIRQPAPRGWEAHKRHTQTTADGERDELVPVGERPAEPSS